MNNIKKHWKIIVIVLLVIFGMNKCTTSCSQSTVINNQEIVIDSLEKRVDTLKNIVNMQSLEISQMTSRINDNKEIAIGNNEIWRDSVTVLSKRLQDMTAKYDNEVKEHNKTKKELKKLQENK